ncbi:MAG: hypothetical protein CEE38_14250 [Planctomycetes bacterium B3_Pla]|nr:MAG: hypothetical protein CEE38_14250 [Planctomycetes bacterium B3_Pla]
MKGKRKMWTKPNLVSELIRRILRTKNDQKKGEQKIKSMTNKNLYKSLPVIFAGAILMLVTQGVLARQTFTVNNTNDRGTGSLREAIELANANPGLDLIAFNIPGSGPHTIQRLTPSPKITDPVTIDGYTQPGAMPATHSSPAALLIELDGINVMAPHWDTGLTIYTRNSTVRGLVINRFGDAGIHIEDHVGGNIIEGNYIGTDVTGALGRGNFGVGVRIWDTPDNRIGGATPEARNVISGHEREGIAILLPDAAGNQILGNYIGTDATGATALGNGDNGVLIYEGANHNTIGPGNVISNHDYGIQLLSSSDNQIYNNSFIDNTIQIYANTGRGGNIFNLEKPIGGNYWSDRTTPDADGDGFVDSPYVFTGGVDYLPWARQDGWLPPPPPILPDIAVTDPNLVAWYRFDGDASDISGNNLHGTEMGNPTYEAGVFGQAISLDGDGDYVDCGLAPEFDITDFITFTYWIKVVEFDKGWNTVLSKGDDSWRSSRAARNNFMEAAVTGTTGDYTYGVTPVDDRQWHHVGFVYDGKRNYLYLDGELDASEPSTGQINVSSHPLWIGENSQFQGGCWNGLIDDVQIYNRALSQEEVQIIMQRSSGEYPRALSPTPADGDMHAYAWVNLRWRAGDFAVSHDVYFGANFDGVNDGTEGTFRGNQAETFFIAGLPGFPYPNGLVPDTTYYWRIDEVNNLHPDSPWIGDVWSFSIPSKTAYTPKHFEITYYDNYNYDTDQWDAWQSDATPRDAWDDKYLANGLSGNTVYTDHAFTSIAVFNLRGSLFSKDGHATGEDWNPLQSIGDNVSGQSAHHVFAALFKGLIYLEEGDVLWVASDDDVYVFLDDDTKWGQEVLSVPSISFFDTDSMTVTAAQAGYHTITVKYIERLNIHSGIEITLNGEHLQNAEVVIDIEPGRYPLSEALDTALSFTTGGDADWFSQTTTSQYGADAAQSGDISHNQESWVQTTVSGAGTVNFYWKVSSETLCDVLVFYIDGSVQDRISGSVDWRQMTYEITDSDLHTLEWRYTKDVGTDSRSDCGWVDKVEWVPAP